MKSSLYSLELNPNYPLDRINHLNEITDVSFIAPPQKKLMPQDFVPFQMFADAPVLGAESTTVIENLEALSKELKSLLKEGEVEIHFRNSSNEQAVMICTLDDKLIPEHQRVLPANNPLAQAVRSPNPMTAKLAKSASSDRVLKVYSTDRAGWRSVRLDRINKIVKT